MASVLSTPAPVLAPESSTAVSTDPVTQKLLLLFPIHPMQSPLASRFAWAAQPPSATASTG